MNLVQCPNCQYEKVSVPVGFKRTENVVCPECNYEFQVEWKVESGYGWAYMLAAIVFCVAVIAYFMMGPAHSACLPLAHEAVKLHGEMSEVFHAYQNLKTSPDAVEHSAAVLQAADHTLELAIETINKLVETLICADLLEPDSEKDGIEH